MTRRQTALIGLALCLVAGAAWWWRTSRAPEAAAPAIAAPEPASGGRRRWEEDETRSPSIRDRLMGRRGPGQVEGRVLDVTTGEPVPYVDILFRGRGGEYTANSGEEGSYSTALDAGTYDVWAAGEGVLGMPTAALRVTGRGEPVRFDVRVQRAARLTGVVIDSSGRPVPGAAVEFVPSTDAQRTQLDIAGLASTATADASGAFAVDVIPGADVYLEAAADGRLGVVTVDAVKPGTTRTDVLIALADAAIIAGIVVDPRGAPVVGALVHVKTPSGATTRKQEVPSDARGRFEVSVMPGIAVLEAHAADLARSSAREVKVEAGQRQEIQLELQLPQVLAGRVLDPTGAPAVDVRVRAGAIGSRVSRMETQTDASGRFRFDNVSANRYWVGAYKPGYATAEARGIVPPAADVELRLMVNGGIRGRVVDETGKPLTSFEVTIEGYTRVGQKRPTQVGKTTRHSDPDGRFELHPVEPGQYELRVDAGGRQARMSVTVGEGGWAETSATLK